MFSFLLLALPLISSVSSLVVPRQQPPQGWAADYLEPYTQYHERYLAIGCQDKHSDTKFFDDCCHPLLASEKLETARPAKCIPSSSTLPTDAGDDDCNDGGDSSSVAQPTPIPSPTSTHTDSPSSTPEPSTTTSHTSVEPENTPKPAAPSPVLTSGIDIQTGGHATFFYQNGVAGACGTVHSDNAFIAAVDGRRYGNLSAQSSLCGKKVKITNTSNGKSVTVVVADACPTCDSPNSIDLSEAAFKEIAQLSDGYVTIKWTFL